jgi:hypothetical protein
MSCTCGCCDGGRGHTPADTTNAPAQPVLRYRVGEHGSFLGAMLAGLSDPVLPTLAALRTRLPADPSMALLDAGATLLDVLTFYQERIANEGYLRTATEQRSLLELARLVAYRPRPGVSAGAYLAFTVEQGHRLTVPAGTKAQSVPGQDELPQMFETSEPLDARAEWNQLAVRRTRPQLAPLPDAGAGPGGVVLWLKGTATGLRRNDPLLVEVPGEATPRLYRVDAVAADQMANRTRVAARPWLTLAIGRTVRLIAASFAIAAGSIATTDTGKRVLDILGRLDDAAARERPEAVLDFLTRKVLPEVRRELAGLGPTATRLGPWLTALISSLDAAEADARSAIPAAPVAAQIGFDLGTATAAAMRAQPAGPRNAAAVLRTLDTGLGARAAGTLGVVAALQPALRELVPALVANARVAPAPGLRVYALRVRASLFGYNAPRKLTGYDAEKAPTFGNWNGEDIGKAEDETTLHLDARYEAVAPGSWVVVDTSSVVPSIGRLDPQVAHFPRLVARVVSVRAGESRSAYGLTGPTTSVTIAGADGEPSWIMFPSEAQPVDRVFLALGASAKASEGPFDIIRRTSVLAGSELLELDEAPIDTPLCGAAGADAIELTDLQFDLQPGRWVIVSGERTDVPGTSGIMGSELRLIAGVRHDVARAAAGGVLAGEATHTFVTLASPLAYCYRRATVTVWGNVVNATHGETRRETLGAGAGAEAFQHFTLRASPLTYTAAPTAEGVASSLEVRVNEVRWHELASLAGAEPVDHIYVASTSDDAKTTITFGDGVRGARLPTGRDNVRGVYRTGIGRSANVGAGRISLLASRPLGLKEVVNPLPASGGADADSAEQIRRNVPLGLQALDRLVSLRDYADFARAFAGIGKASASRLSDGRRELVHVTIAGVDDVPILPTSDLFASLQAAFVRLGDPRQPVQLAVRELVLLVVAARVRVAPDYRWELVEPHVRAALLTAFGFERRELGVPVASSEVIVVIAGVRGVAYVDLDTFGGIPEFVADAGGAGVAARRRPITPDEIAALVAARVRGIVTPGEPCGWLPPFCPVGAHLAGPDEKGVLAPAQLAILSPAAPDTLVLTAIP